MKESFEKLDQRLREIHDIESALAMLRWDQATFMPPEAAESRARQMACLSKISHNMFASDETAKLIEKSFSYVSEFGKHSYEYAVWRLAKREYDIISCVPSEFIEKLTLQVSRTYHAWERAFHKGGFSDVYDDFSKLLEMSQQYAAFFKGYASLLDALIAQHDYGMTTKKLDPLFNTLQDHLARMLRIIRDREPPDNSFLFLQYSCADQIAFGNQVARECGYDFLRGRQDISAHPFTEIFSIDDVRITTRVKEHDFSEAFFSTIHEVGHALYEQNISHRLEGSILAGGTSAGVHESQSRLWENCVAKSRVFWEWQYENLQKVFPKPLQNISIDTFYQGINRIQQSLIRTDSDEVSYNLHVIIRYNLEKQLLDGTLSAKDLPEAWNHQYETLLGLCPKSDREGVLQDMHWFSDPLGGQFQGYTLGNIMSVQFFNAACAHSPVIKTNMKDGVVRLLSWLRENVHTYGSMLDADELIVQATGSELSVEPYLEYLRAKFSDIYGVNL